MRRFLIICLAAVFTLPAADANTIFWKNYAKNCRIA